MTNYDKLIKSFKQNVVVITTSKTKIITTFETNKKDEAYHTFDINNKKPILVNKLLANKTSFL